MQLQRYTMDKALTTTFYNVCIITFYDVHSLLHLFIPILRQKYFKEYFKIVVSMITLTISYKLH